VTLLKTIGTKLGTKTAWVRPLLCKLLKTKGALDSQPQVIKFANCLPMVGGSLRVLRLLPPLNLVDMIGLYELLGNPAI
jgi:hypothetical protein